MTDTPAVGRRERKKAATRQAIADAALELFLEHGFERVSVRDVAEKADVSTTTLFAHFPAKEALVFDREAEVEAALTAAVRERPAGQDVVEALRAHALTSWVRMASDPRRDGFTALVEQTPALREYGERMWMRHAGALGAAIAAELGRETDDLACSALARFVLEIPSLATGRHHSRATVETVFDLLIHGWQSSRHGSGDRPAPAHSPKDTPRPAK
ncbi:TetR/AcrR family transcriptional regulator [Streptomyces beijiangensis]|uniref:TetR family transcriptional regulator n=1 Tax=Streptomyces beijiangensis TaxID=163361 RepID=A0A939JKC0_9ACTN|nr:TetR/AcrR family transcriptional regulator [Streptomyces beijiangensis]MBO0517473.1 TetR family transcriptional regulator [Streptomyces beijiangensis]